MKKNNLVKSLVIGTISTVLLFTTVYASTAGSSDDPIVTKSYVDQQVTSIMNIISNNANSNNSNSSNNSNNTTTIADLTDAQKKEIIENVTSQVLTLTNTTSYVPVELKKGQVLLGEEGTEIILRSGSCNAYVTSSNGVVNATNGTELFNNNKVEKNNILIIPRADGRGVKATSDGTWFIVKGSYTIS